LFTTAKEIEATNEWQLLQPGDTIPAGLHVRMDLETGQKWAKLIDDDNDDSEQETANDPPSASPTANPNPTTSATSTSDEPKSTSLNILPESTNDDTDNINTAPTSANIDAVTGNVKITQLKDTAISPDQSAKITSTLLAQAEKEEQIHRNKLESIASLNDFESSEYDNELDYEMMYRTLKSLPDEDQLSMGLPLNKPSDGASKEEWEAFIQTVKNIWDVRQQELKRMEEEYLVDIPDIIRERVQFLEHYITTPLSQIYSVARQSEEYRTIEDGFDIITVLEDLEFQLADLDLARDFHIMGGWPILVSLLTDSIHQMEHINVGLKKHPSFYTHSSNSKNGNGNETKSLFADETDLYDTIDKMQETVWKVQTLASWTIGTAVKNVEEFHSWSMEDLSHLIMDGNAPLSSDTTSNGNGGTGTNTAMPTNLISILASKLNDNNLIDYELASSDIVKTRMKLMQKQMYALGATLRGNRAATQFFTQLPQGPSVLVDLVNSLMKMDTIDRDASKVLLKIATLADDMIQDVTLNPSSSSSSNDDNESDEQPQDIQNSKELDDEIIASFTSEGWCSIPSQVVVHVPSQSQHQIYQTILTMSPYCSYGAEFIETAKAKMTMES